MEEFEPSSDAWNREWSSSLVRTLGIGNGGVRTKFRCLELGMEEFESGSEAWNRKWRSSSQVLTPEIGNGGVPSQVRTLGIGNGGVRAKFGLLESEMEEFG